MRLHRFFVEKKIMKGESVPITDAKLLHQWRAVLRLKTGGEVILFDGSGIDYRCEFASLEKREAVCGVLEEMKESARPTQTLVLFASLIKKDRFEWLMEKATELGVSEIRPVIADRSEVKKLNLERGRDILKEATEQSGWGSIPTLHGAIELQAVLKEQNGMSLLAFDRDGKPFKKEEWSNGTSIGVFIGPEGGWSARELALFGEQRTPVCSLGTSTLRAETAGVAVTSLLLLSS